jgi:hypothetical protein
LRAHNPGATIWSTCACKCTHESCSAGRRP